MDGPNLLTNIDILGRLDLRPGVLNPLLGSALPEFRAIRSSMSVPLALFQHDGIVDRRAAHEH
jgi:hypothetical protein